MMFHHKWHLDDIENLIPWEREFMIELVAEEIKKADEQNMA